MTLRDRLRPHVHSARRLKDVWVGPEVAEMRRLIRSGRVEYGEHSYGAPAIKSYSHDPSRLVIGRYCSITDTVTVMIGGEHATDRVTTYPHRIKWNLPGAGEDGIPVVLGDTVIGSDVWLCQLSFVRAGVTVGHGAVVAAGAVVVRDVPPFAIVAGNPARVVRLRHTEEQIAALLEIRWWDWADEDVLAAVSLLQGSDIDAFITYARERYGDDYPWVTRSAP